MSTEPEHAHAKGGAADAHRLVAALRRFRSAEVSAGAAAELAGVDRFMFAAECARHGIPMMHYDPGELRDEVNALPADRG